LENLRKEVKPKEHERREAKENLEKLENAYKEIEEKYRIL
jgi:hypothetical protein